MFTLADHLSSHGPLESFDAVGWALRTARQVETLHARGLVHGRISTLSVLSDGPECTEAGYLAAVPEAPDVPACYSPERAARGRPSVADDVWAIAVTLYQLLTGRLPFAGVSDEDIRVRIRAGNPAPVAVFGVDDDGLQSILDRVFVRPGDRPRAFSPAPGSEPIRDAAALVAELLAWLPDPAFGDLPALGDASEESCPEESQRTGIRSSVFPGPAPGEPAARPRPASTGGEREATVARRARELLDAITRAHVELDDEEDEPKTDPYRRVTAPGASTLTSRPPREDEGEEQVWGDATPTAVAFGWPPMPASQPPSGDDEAPPTVAHLVPVAPGHGLRWGR